MESAIVGDKGSTTLGVMRNTKLENNYLCRCQDYSMTDGLFQNTRIAKGGTPLPHPLPRVRKHERIHHHINNLHTQDYEFDDNGNMVSVSVAKKKNEEENPEGEQEATEEKDVLKSFLWDEENRLLAVNNNGSVSCYFYDAAGERTVKLTSESEMVHVNGKKVGGNANICKFTAYVSPYFVVSNGGAYTKHIYAASQRIASKLGNEDGFGADPRRVEMAGGKKISDIQKDNIGARYKELGFTYSAPEKEKALKDSTMDSEDEEKLIFYYHPDHLGSTSYVTDADGNIAQHVEYIPYGEVFVEERNSQFSTNFLFNAKELDNETGLYYYGARYLDPTGAMWLSVDPVFHAGTSPYAYCLGNPVKMVDPDGRENIVYLVDLMTSKQQKNVTAAEVIEYVNNTFQNLGIKTRVQMAPLGFDPKYIDAHDSYAVLGSRNAIKQFVESKDKNSYDKYFADWSTGDVAERAALDGEKWTSNTCHYEGSFTTGVGVDVDATSDVTCPELSSYHTNPVEYTAFTLMHALGHNAKAIHPDDRKCKGAYDWKGSDMTIMYSGSALSTMISNDDIPSLSECMKLFPKSNCGEKRNNIGFIFIMFDRFGNKTPVDNYERKRMELNR